MPRKELAMCFQVYAPDTQNVFDEISRENLTKCSVKRDSVQRLSL